MANEILTPGYYYNDGKKVVLLENVTSIPDGAAGGDLAGTYPNPTVNNFTIFDQEQGSLVYFNGTSWVQLAPGTDGYVLNTHSTNNNPTWELAQPLGPANGDLGGNYPNPVVNDLTISGEQTGSLLYFNGSNWIQLSAGNDGYILSISSLTPNWLSSDTLSVSGDVSGTLSNITLNNTVVDTAELVDDSVTFDKIQNITTDRLLGRDTAASGSVEEISLGDGLQFSGTQSLQLNIDGASLEFNATILRRAALTGDVTATAGSNALSIASNVITNTHINASAAIAYSKLNLANSILNADINASAAITYSKLSLTGGIVNADINASAAIDVSKLNNASVDGYMLMTKSSAVVWDHIVFQPEAVYKNHVSGSTLTLSWSTHKYIIDVNSNITSLRFDGEPSGDQFMKIRFINNGSYTININNTSNVDTSNGTFEWFSGNDFSTALSFTTSGVDLMTIDATKNADGGVTDNYWYLISFGRDIVSA